MVELPQDILTYHQNVESSYRKICELLASAISESIPEAQGKVWHAHPVWFLGSNPILGYSTKKAGVELLFWSGQSFTHQGLKPVGKFKAAGIIFTTAEEIDATSVSAWLSEAVAIQWNYASLPKLRTLQKLTSF